MPKRRHRGRKRFGWVDRPADVERTLNRCPHPTFQHAAAHLKGTGAGGIYLWHKTVEQVVGRFPMNTQTIGDCVSHGAAGAVQTLMCVEIVEKNDPEKWIAEVATEPIYAGSRVEVGRGQLGDGDGSLGSWGAEWVKEWGILLRQKYGQYDLRRYSGAKAKEWGRARNGCPDILEPIAREHPVRTVSLYRSYDEARDGLANGYIPTVASMQGFTTTRDGEGFLRPSGRWPHQMYFVAADDEYRRPGLLCVNSWGNDWVTGPKRHGQPQGSFWVDADVVDGMAGQGDSWMHSNFDGFPRQKLDHMLI